MPYSSPLPAPRSPAKPRRPISPSTTATSAPGSLQDEDSDLADSFIVVAREDDAESTSTIGTALLAELSDTSSEARYEGSLDGSIHGELSDDGRSRNGDHLSDSGQDGLEGSYADAEATASILTDSRATLASAREINRRSSQWGRTPMVDDAAIPSSQSQFKFIFPNLDASISTVSGETVSDATTPSGSLAALRPLPQPATATRESRKSAILGRGGEELNRGIDEKWLRDARIWAPVAIRTIDSLDPPTPPNKSWIDQPPQRPGPAGELGGGAEHDGNAEEQRLSALQDRYQQMRRVVTAMATAGLGSMTKRW